MQDSAEGMVQYDVMPLQLSEHLYKLSKRNYLYKVQFYVPKKSKTSRQWCQSVNTDHSTLTILDITQWVTAGTNMHTFGLRQKFFLGVHGWTL